ncbi:MAG: hypothetical protein H6Q35_667 [Proteobacteria bacterium]|nr:hypothetical protein [Pseudomonadota bacterium]
MELLNSLDKNPYIGGEPANEAKNEGGMMANPEHLFGAFNTKQFVVGALIGAVGAYLLTNEKAQKNLFKTIAKGTEMFQAGIEEMKERFEDAKAELAAKEA